MTDAKAFRKKAILSALRIGFNQDAEDIAHEAIINRVRGKGKRQSVDQSVVDAIRGNFGKSKYKRKAKRVSVRHLDNLENKTIPPDSFLNYRKMVKVLDMLDRGIFNLYFEYGYTQAEIGKIFDVSMTTISLRMKAGLQSLKECHRG